MLTGGPLSAKSSPLAWTSSYTNQDWQVCCSYSHIKKIRNENGRAQKRKYFAHRAQLTVIFRRKHLVPNTEKVLITEKKVPKAMLQGEFLQLLPAHYNLLAAAAKTGLVSHSQVLKTATRYGCQRWYWFRIKHHNTVSKQHTD